MRIEIAFEVSIARRFSDARSHNALGRYGGGWQHCEVAAALAESFIR